MGKCLVAMSGGPSSVINSTLAGIVKANQLSKLYDRVLGGLNGIEGIMEERFVDLTDMSEEENRLLQQTPGSALGACRYRMRRSNTEDFEKVMAILDKYEIETLFYIGGNDSMDTVAALAEYAEKNNITSHRFIGCPKTIDNDLMHIDHSPGFGSAAKFISATALQCWLDLNSYPSYRKEVFIMETMGRDAGWLAASACLSGIVDILIVPEKPFDQDMFLSRVLECLDRSSKCFVAVSEGAHYADGIYIKAGEAMHDLFGRPVLGGAGRALQEMILESELCQRIRVLDLSAAQRSHASEMSLTDMREAYRMGQSAVMHSADPKFTGQMVSMRRRKGDVYDIEYFSIEAEKVANYVRNFPAAWLKPEYRGITDEAAKYLRPLIQGTPDIITKDGIPAYVKPYYMK